MAEKHLEGLDLNLLLSLHWILTERNITAAAGKIGVSQPAASRALSKLRDIFDDPLLVKDGGITVGQCLGITWVGKTRHRPEKLLVARVGLDTVLVTKCHHGGTVCPPARPVDVVGKF